MFLLIVNQPRRRAWAIALHAAAIALLMVGLMARPAAAQYLSAAPDIPLAAGLQELSDGGLVFDKPQGRIVQIAALPDGSVAPRAIVDFYRASLPNLGWQSVAQDSTAQRLTFTRKGEILRLTFTADLVIFDLAPTGL